MLTSIYLLLLFCFAPAVGFWLFSAFYQILISPLRHVPGPTLARFTDLYFDHPEAAQVIYAVGKADKFAKSSFYRAFAVPDAHARPSVFAVEDIKEHAQLRRLYQSTYAMSALVSYEDFVNECADLFDQRLREMAVVAGSADPAPPADMGHWFQCYAFDVIAMITYSERLGFLDHGIDVANIMASLEGFLGYASHVGIYSWLHPFLFAVRNWFAGKSGSGLEYVINFTQKCMKLRQEKPKGIDNENENTSRMDFLTKFTARHEQDPVTYNTWYVLSGCGSNMTAGSDTTAISLSATLRFLMDHPETTRKLQQEVEEHQSRVADPKNFSFKETQDMPYLQAVIKEALRLNPAVGMPLERVVPDGGATIAGQFFPGGTTVGINSWVEHVNPSVFGPDPTVFRPERWFENDKQKLDMMNRHWIPFGMGARTCIGRHISTLEMAKLIPRLVRDFDFQYPVEIKNEATTKTYWFVKPHGFKVRIHIR
ncbi:cytochrome P450 [Dactylonectria estremocensis]|uniref:Cytochrome P450 n=1 Tax=Dactylonectria estremocensis TaxID=1079267 RepID=A0A9P9E4B6_9HYPO|nr:cytochrome P450 [Dactylonectria estremocensis]